MPELRKDYILDRWVIIAPKRGLRPDDFKEKVALTKKECQFCPGNEDMTPGEILRIEKNGRWFIRVFPNMYPIAEKGKEEKVSKEFFTSKSCIGTHEILVETNDHNQQMWDLPVEDLKLVLETYVQRLASIKARYTLIFKNHGERAGTSVAHSHTQIIGYNHIPELVQDKVNKSKGYKSCPYCSIIKKEAKSERLCFENKDFIAFTPFASRYPYEIAIFPKKHLKSLTEVDDTGPLAEIMQKVLKKLKELDIPYNFYIHNAPEGEDLHFQIIFTPRITVQAGLELGSEEIVNIVSPEDAGRFYRR